MHGTQTRGRLGRWLRQHREGFGFCLRFSAYTIAAFLFLYGLDDLIVVPFTRWIAWLTHGLLRGAGVQAWVSGASVGIPGFAVEIKNNCNALYEIGLYGAAVLAYPASFRRRLAGFLLGAAVLYVVNLLRVVSLLALGRYWPGGFQAAHLYVWQALFLVVVAGCWLGWTTRLRPVA
jgi:exosortase H (IPTLxxWG-CTERM-specific)